MSRHRTRDWMRRAGAVRRAMTGGAAMLALALLAGCGGGAFSPVTPNVFGNQPPQQQAALPVQSADQIGAGPVRIGLILPLTQASGSSIVGTSLRNAAELALSEANGQDLTILVKDDRSTPDGAREAAQAAIGEGAELIVGPLFAPSVREVGRIARAANRPVIAFSTDTSSAARGVYLLSFLVENYVDRVVDYAASRGRKSFAALIPDNDYGQVAEAEFMQAAARNNARVQLVEHYKPGQAAAAVQHLASVAGQIDALFIPEQADAMAGLATQLRTSGIDSKRVQILGTGLWNDARVLSLPALQGAWFAAPENVGFNNFANKYRTKFGSDPTRIATLAYDAVSLVAALARTQGPQRFSEAVLTSPTGFNGADGLFRFRADGQNERGLSILQIGNGSTTIVSPAARTFTAAPNG